MLGPSPTKCLLRCSVVIEVFQDALGIHVSVLELIGGDLPPLALANAIEDAGIERRKAERVTRSSSAPSMWPRCCSPHCATG